MSNAEPLRKNIITPFALVLVALTLTAFYFIGVRFVYGLGAITNLNPGYPWGIWTTIDVVIGTALGCGGFAMALLIYIFNRGQYHPLMRPALLGGVFGYTLGGLAVMFDLGRYWHFYHMVMPSYIHTNSVLLEVALCVMAYVTVLWIEFLPAILERLGLEGLKKKLERWLFLFAALGVVLPMMHQSSLGSTLLAIPYKLSPLWWTQWLPALFVISALNMGYSVVMFEATLVSKTFKTPSEHSLLSKMSVIVGWIALGWLALRFGDLVYRQEFHHAVDGSMRATLFWIENALALFAAVVFLLPAGRASQRWSFLGAVAVLLSGALYRIDAYLVGYLPVYQWEYFPALPELMVTIGVIALEVLLYLIFIKTLPVLQRHAAHR
ncbi:MAG: Ni/Fe-hydrogenase cytochrome b subunit [Alphaproteobacteria bacterium]|nr:Ni/Fe-hydrogenase cytochrome b subunit [Alphaproteobacteria bacterium]